MEETSLILRRSIYTFLQHYQYFTTTSALLALPFSLALLLSQTLVPSSSLLLTVHHRLHSLFEAAGLPSSSEFFAFLDLKLSQTIASFFLTLPFTFSFLLVAKASTIQALIQHKPPFSSFLPLFTPLLLTQLSNTFLCLSANATVFSLLFPAFNFLDAFGLSSSKSTILLSAIIVVSYSIILANTLIICSLALVISGMENCGGFLSILKSCVLIRGRTATALSLALPLNLALSSLEALFHYRIVRTYHGNRSPISMALEAMLIAYLHSILILLDTIVGCFFYRSCKAAATFLEDIQEVWHSYRIDIQEEEDEEEAYANSFFKLQVS